MSFDRENREMHKAICTECGKKCEVPFKPTKGKPVKCSDCFKKGKPQRSFGGNRRFGGNRNFRRERQMHKAICDECKQKCEVPFKPTKGKPIRCKECFSKYQEDQVGKFD